MSTRMAISGWFDEGLCKNATHMLVVCDTFAYEDFPVFVRQSEDVHEIVKKHNRARSMLRVMEVYNLALDKEEQLRKGRCVTF